MATNRALWRTARDWITTIPTLLGFGAVLVVGDLVVRVARWFGPRAVERAVGTLLRALIWSFRFSGTTIEVERDPEVEPGRGYIFLSNHQSMFDIPIFGGVLFSNFPKYVAKAELGKWIPLVSINLREGGNVLIDRRNRTQAVKAIREFGRRCQERNVSAVIFPEGSRSRDGRLGEFRSSGTTALLEAAPELPVVPTAIDGSWRLFENNMLPIPFGTKIRVSFGAPIARSPGEDVGEILAETRERIAATLESWRAGGEGLPA